VQGAKRSQAEPGHCRWCIGSAVRTTPLPLRTEYAGRSNFEGVAKQLHSSPRLRHPTGGKTEGATQIKVPADLNNATTSSGKRIGRSPRGVDRIYKGWSNAGDGWIAR